MSLYGNIKKIDGSNFQFDRIYSNRKEMDNQASSDGVYAGRYVLIEYGERFNTKSQAQASNNYISKLRNALNVLKLQLLNENNKLNTLMEIFNSLSIENIQVSQSNYNLLLATFPIEYQLIDNIFDYNNEINYYIFENDIYRLFSGNIEQWREAVNNKNLYIRKKNFTDFFENSEISGYKKLIATNTNIKEFHNFFNQKIAEKEEQLNETFEYQKNNIITPTGYEEAFSGSIIQENQEFIRNETTDLTTYGTTYDSTIWQKVYVKDTQTNKATDKYIMIAELNAIAPQFDVKVEHPITYDTIPTSEVDLNNKDGVLVGAINSNNELNIVKLINTNENYNEAYFDSVRDTEQRFLMHYPQILQLEAGDNTINYNKNGFNIAYSYNEDNGDNGIVLSPNGITSNDYTQLYTQNNEGKIVEQTDLFGNKLALLNSNKNVDKKSLLMNFPTIGNTMKTLYDLIYGSPEGSDEDLEKGILRPFFKRFAREISFTNKLSVLNSDNEEEYIRIKSNNDILDVGTIVTVKSPIEIQDEDGNWQTSIVEKTFSWQELQGKTIVPNFIRPYYRKINGEIIEMPQEEPNETGECILIDTLHGNNIVKWRMRYPTGDEDDGSTWVDSAPTLQKLFQTNSTGLATILADLFPTSDPLTGQINYYLYNDWTTNTNGDNNIPAILNKPNTIGGYATTFITYPNEGLADLSEGYYLDSTGKAINKNTSKPIKAYSYTDINLNSEIEDGHYQIDYDTWQLVNTADLNAKFNSLFSVQVSKITNPPSDNLFAKNNQEKINVVQSNDRLHVNIYGNKNSIQKFFLNNLYKQWIGLDFQIGQYNINEIKINGQTLNDADVANSNASNLRPGHYAFWIDINDVLIEQKVTVEVQGLEAFEFYIQFFNQDINTIPSLTVNVQKLNVDDLSIDSNIYSSEQTIQSCKFNQDKIKINFESNNKKCIITSNIDILDDYDPINDNINDIGKWIGLDLSISEVATTVGVQINGITWTQEQQNEASKFGLNEKHLIIWEKATNLIGSKSYQISVPNYNDYILIVKFEDYKQLEFNVVKLSNTILDSEDISYKKSQYNQNLINIEKISAVNAFTIRGPINEMRYFEISDNNYGLGKWIYLVIETNLLSIQGVNLNNHIYTAAEETQFLNYGLSPGSILLQVNADSIWNMEDHLLQISIQVNKYEPIIFNLIFYNEASSLPNININVRKMEITANDDNQLISYQNQTLISTEQINNIITISGNIRSLNEFIRADSDVRGRWVSFDIGTSLNSIEGAILNGNELDFNDVLKASEVDLPNGHILYWINLNDFPKDGYVIVLEAEGYVNSMITFLFNQNNLEVQDISKITYINNSIDSYEILNNNQNAITITSMDDNQNSFVISGDYQALQKCNLLNNENEQKKYIGISFEFNINNAIGIKNNEIEYTYEDAIIGKNYYNLPTNISYTWYDVDDLLREKRIIFSKPGYAETEISLIFENTNKIFIPISISKINIDENDNNFNNSFINNQNKIEVILNSQAISTEYYPHYVIKAIESELESFSLNENEEQKKWIGLDINTSFETIDDIVFNGRIINQEDKELANQFNLSEGHIVYYVNIEDIKLGQDIIIKKLNYKDTKINIQFVSQ